MRHLQKLNRRGTAYQELPGVVIVLLIIIIVSMIAIEASHELKATTGQWTCDSGYEYNTTNSICCASNATGTDHDCSTNTSVQSDVNTTIDEGIGAMTDVTGWLDIVVLVIIAAVILGTIGLFGRRD